MPASVVGQATGSAGGHLAGGERGFELLRGLAVVAHALVRGAADARQHVRVVRAGAGDAVELAQGFPVLASAHQVAGVLERLGDGGRHGVRDRELQQAGRQQHGGQETVGLHGFANL